MVVTLLLFNAQIIPSSIIYILYNISINLTFNYIYSVDIIKL